MDKKDKFSNLEENIKIIVRKIKIINYNIYLENNSSRNSDKIY